VIVLFGEKTMAIKSLRDKVVHLPVDNQRDVRPQPMVAERIDYMADMILQLKDMATAGKLHVLSGILEVAYQEARAHARRSS
jgi:hypothetical protein